MSGKYLEGGCFGGGGVKCPVSREGTCHLKLSIHSTQASDMDRDTWSCISPPLKLRYIAAHPKHQLEPKGRQSNNSVCLLAGSLTCMCVFQFVLVRHVSWKIPETWNTWLLATRCWVIVFFVFFLTQVIPVWMCIRHVCVCVSGELLSYVTGRDEWWQRLFSRCHYDNKDTAWGLNTDAQCMKHLNADSMQQIRFWI